MRSSQAILPGFSFTNKLSFGGSKLKSNPKTARPISTTDAMHVVMRSKFAKGQRSFFLHSKVIENIIKKQAKACGVNIYDLANAGNHLHFVIRVPSRRLYRNFMRACTGLIARKVLGREKGSAKESVLSFWDARPFTRIVAWGKSYKVIKNYLMLNRVETLGLDRLSAREMLAKIEALKKSSNLHPFGFV